MPIEDKLEKVLDNLREEGRVPHPEMELLNAAIAAIPLAGSPISSLMSGEAKRRVVRRTVEMFNAMRERLEEIDATKIDENFFGSPEFQTLLALAIEQLQTSHDAAKIRMLGVALANGGVADFASESRKELYVRVLRDLMPSHIRLLKELVPRDRVLDADKKTFWPKQTNPSGEELAFVQTLASHGLVDEFLEQHRRASLSPRYGNEWTISEAQRVLKEYLSEPPTRCFVLNDFGLAFLSYLGENSPIGKAS